MIGSKPYYRIRAGHKVLLGDEGTLGGYRFTGGFNGSGMNGYADNRSPDGMMIQSIKPTGSEHANGLLGHPPLGSHFHISAIVDSSAGGATMFGPACMDASGNGFGCGRWSTGRTFVSRFSGGNWQQDSPASSTGVSAGIHRVNLTREDNTYTVWLSDPDTGEERSGSRTSLTSTFYDPVYPGIYGWIAGNHYMWDYRVESNNSRYSLDGRKQRSSLFIPSAAAAEGPAIVVPAEQKDYHVLYPDKSFAKNKGQTFSQSDIVTDAGGPVWYHADGSNSVDSTVTASGRLNIDTAGSRATLIIDPETLPQAIRGRFDVMTIECMYLMTNQANNNLGIGFGADFSSNGGSTSNNRTISVNRYGGQWVTTAWNAPGQNFLGWDSSYHTANEPLDREFRYAITYDRSKQTNGAIRGYFEGVDQPNGGEWWDIGVTAGGYDWNTFIVHTPIGHNAGTVDQSGIHSIIAYPGPFKDVLGRGNIIRPDR